MTDRGLGEAEQTAGVTIKPNDTVLLTWILSPQPRHAGLHHRLPGLTRNRATWLGTKGIGMFGVEAVSPGRPGRNTSEVHHVCRDLASRTWRAGQFDSWSAGRFRSSAFRSRSRRHRRPDPRGGVAGWVKAARRENSVQRIMIRAAIICCDHLTPGVRTFAQPRNEQRPDSFDRCGERRARTRRRGALRHGAQFRRRADRGL